MGKGLCKLCEKNSVLLKSHVLPKFAYKWMKETSGSGHIRFGVNPNQRSQDGFKLPWLYEACEIKLNNWETEFANKIFHPLNNGKVGTIKYDEWLNLFCISVSWRVLNFYLEQNLLSNYPPNIQKSIIEAIENWRLYLLGQSKSLQKFEMYFFPLKPVTSIDGYPLEEIPANLNVYMLRNIDMDVAFNDDYSFVYVKLGPYIILGIIQFPVLQEWFMSKVINSGSILVDDYNMPPELFQFIIYKAKRAKGIQKRISKKQKEKINQTFKEDMDRLAQSNSLEALDYDVLLFGKDRVFKDEE